MKNITSYQPGSIFLGKELNYWCKEQIRNHGSHEKIARKIYLHFTFLDKTFYRLVYMQYRTSEPGQIGFERIKVEDRKLARA